MTWWQTDPVVGGQPDYGGAIAGIESGGNYRALGPVTRTGDRAYGKYQVMGANVGPWTKEVLGTELKPHEFLMRPDVQDAVFQTKFGQYAQKYGPEGASRAWFAGEKGMNDFGRKDQLGTTVADYSQKFTNALGTPAQAAESPKAGNWWESDPVAETTQAPVAERFGASETGIPDLKGAMEAKAASLRPGALDQALKPLTSYPETYRQMNREARDAMSTGASVAANPDLSLGQRAMGAGLAGLGGVSFVGAPINAALRTFIGNPIQEGTGIPRDYTEFGASLVVPGLGAPKAAKPIEKAVAPTVKQLKESYVAAKNSPTVEAVQISPQAATRQADTILAELEAKKFSESRARDTFGLLNELKDSAPKAAPAKFEMRGLESAGMTAPAAPKATVTMANIDDVRYQLGLIAGGQGPDAAAAQIAKKKLDDWLGGAGTKGPEVTTIHSPNLNATTTIKIGPEGRPAKPGAIRQEDVIAGDVAEAQAIMQAGRGDYARAKVAEALDNRLALGELRAAGANSGLNIANTLKQRMTSFLYDGRGNLTDEAKQLSKTELAAAEQFIKGSGRENFLRGAGNFLGGGGGFGSLASLGIGVGTAGMAGAALPATGFGLRLISNSVAKSDAAKLSELIRSNSPLGKQMRVSVESWEKYAKLAKQRPMTPRIVAMLGLQSRNLSNNLKDAGITVTPEDLVRGVLTGEPSTDK